MSDLTPNSATEVVFNKEAAEYHLQISKWIHEIPDIKRRLNKIEALLEYIKRGGYDG